MNLNQPIECSTKSTVALTDFHYISDIALSLGKLKIIYIPYSENRDTDIDLPEAITKYKDALEHIITQILLIDGNITATVKKYVSGLTSIEIELLAKLSTLENLALQTTNIFIEEDFTFNILVNGQEIDENFIVYRIILKNISKLHLLPKSENFQLRFAEAVKSLDNQLHILHRVLNIYKSYFNKELKIDLRNNIKIAEIVDYFKFFNLINCSITSTTNKILLEFGQSVQVFAHEALKKTFKLKATNKKIEINIGQNLNIIKNFSIFINLIDNTPLQIIKADGNLYENCHKSFENPHYYLINKTYINSIAVEIKDSKNRLIGFSESPLLRLNLKNIRIE